MSEFYISNQNMPLTKKEKGGKEKEKEKRSNQIKTCMHYKTLFSLINTNTIQVSISTNPHQISTRPTQPYMRVDSYTIQVQISFWTIYISQLQHKAILLSVYRNFLLTKHFFKLKIKNKNSIFIYGCNMD
jgi:hypothetical protein